MFFYAENTSKFAFSEFLTDDVDIIQNSHALFGVPFDSTTSYIAGSRNGPKAIREASYNFESYNLHFDKMITPSYDVGDVNVCNGNYLKTHDMIKDTVKTVLEMGLKPIAMGGEHTITNGVVEALLEFNHDVFKKSTIIHFDAHMDMRDTYLDEKYSHATVLHRIHELKPKNIIQLGVRSAEYDEFQYVNDNDDIIYYTSYDIQNDKECVLKQLNKIKTPVYITVDIDVLDPAYAPSVGTPSPCGITPMDLENMLKIVSTKETLGLDVVETSSTSFGDITSINASKVIYDYLCLQ